MRLAVSNYFFIWSNATLIEHISEDFTWFESIVSSGVNRVEPVQIASDRYMTAT